MTSHIWHQPAAVSRLFPSRFGKMLRHEQRWLSGLLPYRNAFRLGLVIPTEIMVSKIEGTPSNIEGTFTGRLYPRFKHLKESGRTQHSASPNGFNGPTWESTSIYHFSVQMFTVVSYISFIVLSCSHMVASRAQVLDNAVLTVACLQCGLCLDLWWSSSALFSMCSSGRKCSSGRWPLSKCFR